MFVTISKLFTSVAAAVAATSNKCPGKHLSGRLKI